MAANGLSAHPKRLLSWSKEAQVVLHEADHPDFFGDFFHPGVLTRDHGGEIDLAFRTHTQVSRQTRLLDYPVTLDKLTGKLGSQTA